MKKIIIIKKDNVLANCSRLGFPHFLAHENNIIQENVEQSSTFG